MIAAAFYPNPVVIRMSDFKTNEYANLLGGGLNRRKKTPCSVGGGESLYDELPPPYAYGVRRSCGCGQKWV